MTGAEHYVEAERLLAIKAEPGEPMGHIEVRAQNAQTHALLALVAAQIDVASPTAPIDRGSQWRAAVSSS